MLRKFPEECRSYIQFQLKHTTSTLALVAQGDVRMLEVCVSNVCNPVTHIGMGYSCVQFVSYPMKLILLLSVVFCLVRTVYNFEFRQDIN